MTERQAAKPREGMASRMNDWFAAQRWPSDQKALPAHLRLLLARAGVSPREDGGTALTEPIVLFRRTTDSSQHYDLFSQDGTPLGSLGRPEWRSPAWVLKDANGERTMTLRRSRGGFGAPWKYAIQAGDGSQIATVEQEARWSSRALVDVDTAHTVGLTLKMPFRAPSEAVIEDESGRVLVSIQRPVFWYEVFLSVVEPDLPPEICAVRLAAPVIYAKENQVSAAGWWRK